MQFISLLVANAFLRIIVVLFFSLVKEESFNDSVPWSKL